VNRFERRELLEDFKRFHNKNFTKKFLKSKDVVHMDKEKLQLNLEDLVENLRKEFIRIQDVEKTTAKEIEDEHEDRIRSVYDSGTQNYLQGVGGLDLETESSLQEYENPQVKQRRLEFNAALRDKPTNVKLWIEFIDFQDEILKESVFDLEEEPLSRAAKKKRGEVMRAKAVTERKLAICRAAIQKNSRSIQLAVKRLELSRDLLDSKTLDQQWKELIFVYPENVELWKRYLLFVQTFYIRFSVGETVKAYRNAILKLRQQQAEYAEEGQRQKLFELEHGILDILSELVTLLMQSGHTEKGIAIYQALLEFNLFAPDFSSPGGYDFDDKISLLEPVWEKGCPRVGEEGAQGWARELNRAQEPLTEDKPPVSEDWEDDILASGDTFQQTWLSIELGREQRHWCPWRSTEEETPEDADRSVDFDTICGFLVEFHREETRFRLLLDLLALLGVRLEDKEFSGLSRSSAMELYYNKDKMHTQSFSNNNTKVLQDTLPTIKTEEHLAIFIHNIFTQCYTKFAEPYRTKCMMLWLEYEASVIRLNHGKAAKELRKDLKKLVRCLLKEDRNNLHLVVKFAELEYQMEGYAPAHNLLETAILASNSGFLKQKTGEDFLSTTLLYRAAVELELREVVRIHGENGRNPDNPIDDSLHRNRLQWLLVHIGCGKRFSAYSAEKSSMILDMLEPALGSFQDWLQEDVSNISCSHVFRMAPFLRHSIVDVVFFAAWLTQLSAGSGEAVNLVRQIRDTIQEQNNNKPGRFNQLELTHSFLVESLDKLTLDILQFNAAFNIVEKVKLRAFYHSCIQRHSSSSYFQSRLVTVQDSTSIVNSIWQEILSSIQDKERTNLPLIEEACAISLDKFMSVLNPDNPQAISALGYGFLYKLSNLLERCVTKPVLKHSPLIWRLLLWCVSIESLRKDSKVGCENLKVMLYRAIQDVPWCKALYMDTALYLGRIGELSRTKKKEVVHSDGEDEEEAVPEKKFEYIPGTLEHLHELLIEKEIRVRVPLQELEVLLEPL